MSANTQPMRAFRLTLRVEADTPADLASELQRIALDIARGDLSNGISAGPANGSIYELLHDPRQTHDAYFEQLQKYLEHSKTTQSPHP